MEKTLTVFTPAFNRAHTLGRTYESLCRQTCKDFEWLVIDDGSTDGTRQLVEQWMSKDSGFPIRYIYQENQGMHGAHNTAYANITTELNTCIDSDDYMPDDAVEKIIRFWKEHGSDKVAGIVGLDVTADMKVIGKPLPTNTESITLGGYYRAGGAGDKKQVYRTEVIKRYPAYPLFKGEKYVGLNYLYAQIDKDLPLLILNEPLAIVEYQADGSSMNMFRQYWNNPKGWCFYRKEMMKLQPTWRLKFKECIHYVSSSIRSKNGRFLLDSPNRFSTILALPVGIVLFVITYIKNR